MTKQECTDPTGHCTCYDRQGYGKCCSCKAINPNPERAVVEGTISSKKETNRDKVLRREVVTLSYERLVEMQEQAIRNEGIGDGYMHWHWTAAINELIARRSAPFNAPLSDDSSASETSLRPGELEQLRRIDRAARTYVDSISHVTGRKTIATFDALLEALYDGRSPAEETSECRRSGLSEDAAGTGPVNAEAEARLSRREVTAPGLAGKAPDGWCEICGGQDGVHKQGCVDGDTPL